MNNNFQGVKFAKNITNDNLISINAQHLKLNRTLCGTLKLMKAGQPPDT